MPFYCLYNDMYKLVGEQQQQLSALTVVGRGLAEQDWKQKEDKAADAKDEWNEAKGVKSAAKAEEQWEFYKQQATDAKNRLDTIRDIFAPLE